MKITLDHGALMALFPEGSEARVELTHSVLASVVGRYVKIPDIKPMVEQLTKESLKGAIDAHAKAAVTDLIEKHITKTVRDAVTERAIGLTDEAIKKRIAKILR